MKHATIGHIGPVTQEFIMQQAGMAPRSIITVIDGEAERTGHGMTIQCTPTFVWYVIVRGVLADRTNDALDFIGHAIRFIYADVFRDADDDKIFSKPPVAKSVKFRSRYMTKDEKTAYTVIGIQWLQEISLGAAGRARDGDGCRKVLPPEGDMVSMEGVGGSYWTRRINEGSVEKAEPPKAPEPKQPTAEHGKKDGKD